VVVAGTVEEVVEAEAVGEVVEVVEGLLQAEATHRFGRRRKTNPVSKMPSLTSKVMDLSSPNT
jgi:hypothetical protein